MSQAVRDVLVTAINRGQLPALGVIAIVLTLLWRMPESDISTLVFDLLDTLKKWQTTGYVLFLLCLFFWYIHVKHLRKAFSEEMRRVGREKSGLQNKHVEEPFKSSENQN